MHGESTTVKEPLLYMVATPIGNLGDMTYRGVEVLKSVDEIFCEDTRHSHRLFQHYAIDKPTRSANAHNGVRAVGALKALWERGGTAAYVSDAGTPGISDPGVYYVKAAQEAGVKVIPLPGASALTALASASPLPLGDLQFAGFLSNKSGTRKNQLSERIFSGTSCLFYESPYRIVAFLNDVADLDPERPLTLGREMTKIHEEVIHGSARELAQNFASRASIKGEFAIMVHKLVHKGKKK